jgi:hypothetical protein
VLKSSKVALCATKNLGAGKTRTGLERPHFLPCCVAKVNRGVVPAHRENRNRVLPAPIVGARHFVNAL